MRSAVGTSTRHERPGPVAEMSDWVSPRLGICVDTGGEELRMFAPDGPLFGSFGIVKQACARAQAARQQAEQQVEQLAARLRDMGVGALTRRSWRPQTGMHRFREGARRPARATSRAACHGRRGACEGVCASPPSPATGRCPSPVIHPEPPETAQVSALQGEQSWSITDTYGYCSCARAGRLARRARI